MTTAMWYSDGSVNACRVSIPDHAGREGYLREYPSHAEVKAHMQTRLQQGVACPTHAGAVTTTLPSRAAMRQCMSTCPAGTCTTRTAVKCYARRHAGELEARFQRAVVEGFDALWQFGVGVAYALWPEAGRQHAGPFCAVMAIAGSMGMSERDMQVLRGNMARLSDTQRQGGPT